LTTKPGWVKCYINATNGIAIEMTHRFYVICKKWLFCRIQTDMVFHFVFKHCYLVQSNLHRGRASPVQSHPCHGCWCCWHILLVKWCQAILCIFDLCRNNTTNGYTDCTL